MFAKLTPLALIASLGIADARPTVIVGPGVPLDERELRDAVELRIEGDVSVYVSRDPSGVVTVDVGGRLQTLDISMDDPAAAARVVAMVAFALVLDPVPVAVAGPSKAPITASLEESAEAPTPTKISKFQIRAVPTLFHDDGGYTYPLFTASLAYRLSKYTRLTTTVGTAAMQEERAFPVRLGIEGIAGALGIEIGGSATYHATRCGGAQTGGVYGAAHIYAPVTAKARLVFEGGGYFVVAKYTTQSIDFDSVCFGPHVWQGYAGWMGAGLEWSL